jgi:hypothetical protein
MEVSCQFHTPAALPTEEVVLETVKYEAGWKIISVQLWVRTKSFIGSGNQITVSFSSSVQSIPTRTELFRHHCTSGSTYSSENLTLS